MPLIDMPLAELERYNGRNPRPADFDQYWERALAEMRGLDPQVELVPYELPALVAEGFDLYFTGVDGARVHAKYLRPAGIEEPHGAVLMFHGYSGNSGDWAEKLGYVSQGYSVAALDVRGQGGRSEDVGGVKGYTLQGHVIRGLDDEPERLLFRSVFLDCAQLAGIVMGFPEVNDSQVAAIGASQGGALTLACAALEPRVVRAVSVHPFLSDYRRVWEMDLAQDAYAELGQYFRLFDPRHEREDEIFTRLGYIDVQNLAPRIKASVMMVTGLMDTVCPPSTQFAAYNKIESQKEMVLYPDFGHEVYPGLSDLIFLFLADLFVEPGRVGSRRR
jgi:cephalosporin-C deacetylase